MASTKTEITKKATGGELAVFNYGTDAGAGYEDQTSDDVQVPFIAVIQDLSPQHKKKRAEYIEGAEVGDLFNTVTNELVPQGFEFIAFMRDHCFVEWIPRDKGGGFVARHERESEIVRRAKAESRKFGKYTTPDGNDLQETFYVWGLAIINGTPTPAIIAFTSTKIKVFKKWNTARNMFRIQLADGTRQNPPMFAHLVAITTIEESRGDNDFFNLILTPAAGTMADSLMGPDDPRYLLAKKWRDDVAAGGVKVDYAQEGTTEGGDDDDVPF